MSEPMRHYAIQDKMTINGDTVGMMSKLAVKFVEEKDNFIFEKIADMLKIYGITDLIVLDKNFILEALKEKQERDNKCEDCINYVCNTFGMACYECGRYYADGFKPKEV